MNTLSIRQRLQQATPVMPIISLDDSRKAMPLAEVLITGGARVRDVTLRTPASIDAIRAVKAMDGALECPAKYDPTGRILLAK